MDEEWLKNRGSLGIDFAFLGFEAPAGLSLVCNQYVTIGQFLCAQDENVNHTWLCRAIRCDLMRGAINNFNFVLKNSMGCTGVPRCLAA